MDDADFALARLLAKCQSREELEKYVMAQAVILQFLVCHMAREVRQTEAGIRALYTAWADMAVEQLHDPRSFASKILH